MAITKVGAMTDPPVAGDYAILQAKLDAYAKQVGNQGMILTEWTNTTTVPKIAMGSYITHGGTLFIVDTEDFAVTEPAGDGTYYLKVSVSGDTLAVSWVASLTGYTWNAIYNGLYHSDESQILPYQLVKSGATLTKRKITNLMQGSGFVTVDYLGAISGASLTGPKTVDHDNETNIANEFAGGTLYLNYRGATAAITELVVENGMAEHVTVPIKCSSVVTTNGPNKPVDNNGASMPSVGIGGFSYATASAGSGRPSITIGSGGTWVYIVHSTRSDATDVVVTKVGRISGGSSVQGDIYANGNTTYVYVIAWRIA